MRAAARQIEFKRAEANQRAFAVFFYQFRVDEIGVADKIRDETARRLLVQFEVEKARAFGPEWNVAARGPADEVRQNVAVVWQVVQREPAVEVRGKKRDAAPWCRVAQD